MRDSVEEKELYADSIEFSYTGYQPLLTGVFIRCQIGEVVALLGRNGCGKSTLMKILFGTIVPKMAYIKIDGVRVHKGYLSKKVCYLPQHSFLPPYHRLQKIIKLMVPKVENQRAIEKDEIIQKIITQKIGEISVGERRYFELLVLLNIDADYYLLDEPFSGVAPYLKERIQDLIHAHKPTKGFIISDHHYTSVLDISTSIMLLQNGGCRRISNKKELEMFYVPEGTFEA